MSECKGIAGWLLGHAFEPAFDVRPGNLDVHNVRTSAALVRVMEANAERIYKGHVCRRCGAVVQNKEQ